MTRFWHAPWLAHSYTSMSRFWHAPWLEHSYTSMTRFWHAPWLEHSYTSMTKFWHAPWLAHSYRVTTGWTWSRKAGRTVVIRDNNRWADDWIILSGVWWLKQRKVWRKSIRHVLQMQFELMKMHQGIEVEIWCKFFSIFEYYHFKVLLFIRANFINTNVMLCSIEGMIKLFCNYRQETTVFPSSIPSPLRCWKRKKS